LDYPTAFGSLSRAWVWDDPRARGLPRKLIEIIREGYEDLIFC
jgi:hypothetical protein